MKVEFYIPERHYSELKSFYYKRGLEAPLSEDLPPTGVFIEGQGACFMVSTDSRLCLIEGLIVSSTLSRNARGRAARALIKRIIEIAKARRFKQIIGITKVECIQSVYGKHFNFKEIGNYMVIAKQL